MASKVDRDWTALLLKVMVFYGLVSIVTLPFLGAIWWNELPVLSVFQAPKLIVADWLRSGVVMDAIKILGFSSGSYSPDHARAGPYALAITYLVPLVAVLGLVWFRTRMVRPYRGWTLVLLGVAVLDFILTLVFRSRPGLSIY